MNICVESITGHIGLLNFPHPSPGIYYSVCSSLDLPVEAEPGDAALPVAVITTAAAAPVQSGEGAPEDAAG